MSKKDQYGLDFIKIIEGGNVGYNCIRKNGIVDQNNLLQFLTYLNISGTEILLHEVNSHLNSIPDPNPYDSMVLEHIDLQIHSLRFIIDKQPDTFPLADIRDLLKEWLSFLQS
ncbi:hypothetical protein CLU96_2396 [Chryseobacterium sp. 52]|uniref:hypothetical protein n=1 Tax=Chryseobacterium sp. 52 TaxID=2035213 RepID=UPI000C65BD1A|nr:hypothetical protein [Chryseobacterium sp. 52]PIF45391.1 hypothetical protein CLU96_2396 [Chryseobacterium sp. 52]